MAASVSWMSGCDCSATAACEKVLVNDVVILEPAENLLRDWAAAINTAAL